MSTPSKESASAKRSNNSTRSKKSNKRSNKPSKYKPVKTDNSAKRTASSNRKNKKPQSKPLNLNSLQAPRTPSAEAASKRIPDYSQKDISQTPPPLLGTPSKPQMKIPDARESKTEEEQFANTVRMENVAILPITNVELQWRKEDPSLRRKKKGEESEKRKKGSERRKRPEAKEPANEADNGQSPRKENEDGKKTPAVETGQIDPKNMATVLRVMEAVKKHSLLENALVPAENDTLRAFFASGEKDPNDKVVELLAKGFDQVVDALLLRGEELAVTLDQEMKDLCREKPLLKALMQYTMLTQRETYLPQSWGGRGPAVADAGAEAEKKA